MSDPINPSPNDNALPASAEPNASATLEQHLAKVMQSRDELAERLEEWSAGLGQGALSTQCRSLGKAIHSGESVTKIAQNYPSLLWILTLDQPAAQTRGLLRMAEHEAMQAATTSRRMRAVAYPCSIAVASLGLLVFLGTFVLPQFREMYDEFELSLPGITELVCSISDLMMINLTATIGMVALFLTGMIFAAYRWATARPKPRLVNNKLWLPSVSENLSQVCSQVAELARQNLDTPSILAIVSASCSEPLIRVEIDRIAASAQQVGERIAPSNLRSSLPSNVLYALRPRTSDQGPNIALLQQLAHNYHAINTSRRETLTLLLGQSLIILTGMIIGITVFSILAPMLSLITSLS